MSANAINEIENAWKAVSGNDKIFSQFVPRKNPPLPFAVLTGVGGQRDRDADGRTRSQHLFELRVRWKYEGGSISNYMEGFLFVNRIAEALDDMIFAGADFGPDLTDPSFIGSVEQGYIEFSLLLAVAR